MRIIINEIFQMKEFIIEIIEDMTKKFPKIKASYYFDDFNEGNFIYVLPIDTYKNDKEYKDFETKIILSFIDQHLYECIAFITKDSVAELLDMKLIHTSIGKLYKA